MGTAGTINLFDFGGLRWKYSADNFTPEEDAFFLNRTIV